ncbi:MAG: LacI family DNA-binding transcriptional regulator [Tessaracoccus sp.]|uniref:LacI family DNA-binding transcriptional regulator n=1 Tax=Tessaracoccus sp. TaxID=1971211 RepID=UPI001ED12E00|nr:LacI family DNA-binding transcriptional regulator [Tessaracoccus sp.]MBK7821921.1 LacI family DNA-binding transcriptional regulator [Tessaracoccus sp.]
MAGYRISDVAAAAGVSTTTVSHALSGRRAVAEETKKRIHQAIKELNYRPSIAAQSLRSRKSYSVALIVSDIANPYYPSLARAIHDRLDPEGYVTLICNTNGDAATEERFLQDMVARGVDGMIMTVTALGSARIREIVGPDLPIIGGGTDASDVGADHVGSDDARGILHAVEYLAGRGIRDIGFVSGPEGELPSVVRLDSFRRACGETGIEVREEWITHTPFTHDGGIVGGGTLLGAPTGRPRAIMCANDLIAVGVVEAARAAGLTVPDDLSVIGFDDIDLARLVSPKLTTIENPAVATGLACAEALIRRIDDRAAPPLRIDIPTRLIVRGTA